MPWELMLAVISYRASTDLLTSDSKGNKDCKKWMDIYDDGIISTHDFAANALAVHSKGKANNIH